MQNYSAQVQKIADAVRLAREHGRVAARESPRRGMPGAEPRFARRTVKGTLRAFGCKRTNTDGESNASLQRSRRRRGVARPGRRARIH